MSIPRVSLKPVTNAYLQLMAEELGMKGEVYMDESNPSNMVFIKLGCMRCDRGEWNYKIEIHEKDGRIVDGLYICEKCIEELTPKLAEREAKIVKVGKR